MNLVGVLVRDLDAELLYPKTQTISHPSIVFSPRVAPACVCVLSMRLKAYLLNSHHDLNGVQAVQTKVVREVSGRGDL